MKNTITFSILLAGLLLVCGCSWDRSASNLQSVSSGDGSVVKNLTFDLGTLESDYVFDCLIGSDDVKTVKNYPLMWMFWSQHYGR